MDVVSDAPRTEMLFSRVVDGCTRAGRARRPLARLPMASSICGRAPTVVLLLRRGLLSVRRPLLQFVRCPWLRFANQ